MIAYLIAPVLALISSIFIFLPSELVILILANMNEVKTIPVNIAFLHINTVIDLSRYGTDFPWLLPFAMALGSNIGSTFYYFMGTGALRVSEKFTDKINSFDFNKLGKTRDTVVFVSGVISVPPVSLTAIASGMIKYRYIRYFIVSFSGKVCRYYLVLIAGQFAIDSLKKFLS